MAALELNVSAAQIDRASNALGELARASNNAQREIDSMRGAVRSADDAVGRLNDSSKQLGVTGIAVGNFLASAFMDVARSVGSFSVRLLDNLDALNDVSDATGSSVENLSALEDVASRTGTSFDAVESGLVRLNAELAKGKDSDTAAALKAIGLSVADLKKEDPAEAMRQIAAALGQFADGADKARLIQEIFGKSVKEMGPYLKELGEQGRLNATTTTEQAQAAEAFNKQLAFMKTNVEQAARSVLSDFIPALNEILKTFNEKGLLAAIGKLFEADNATLRLNVEIAKSELDRSKKALEGGIPGFRPGFFAWSDADIQRSIKENQTRYDAAVKAYDSRNPHGGSGRGFVNPPNAMPSAPSIPDKPDKSKKPKAEKAYKGDFASAAAEAEYKAYEKYARAIDAQLDERETAQREAFKDSIQQRERAAEATKRYNDQMVQTADRYRALIDPNFVIIEQLKEVNRLEAEGFLGASQALSARELLQKNILDTQDTFSAGWNNAFKEFELNAYNSSKAGADAFATASGFMEDGIYQFVTTGKANFRDLARNAIASIAQIYAKMVATKLVNLFVNAYGASSTTDYSVAAGGGVKLGDTGGDSYWGSGVKLGSSTSSTLGSSPVYTASANRSPASNAITFGDIIVQGGTSNAETAANLKATMLKEVVPVIKSTIANEQRHGGLLAA